VYREERQITMKEKNMLKDRKRVFQTQVEQGEGDCMRACVATLFELDVQQVPHFTMFKEPARWYDVFKSFIMDGLGYEWQGSRHAHYDRISIYDGFVDWSKLLFIDDMVLASVKSKTFKDTSHMVIMNKEGVVVHDPNPNGAWQGINIIESQELIQWYSIGRTPPVVCDGCGTDNPNCHDGDGGIYCRNCFDKLSVEEDNES
jgi:hypothetical protein